ncbi:GNAT family N-acetyltransferase [Paenibacillus sp. WLX2291]|uniref:GNAT family N-acetyltransferase n=1 Tax=Paenibacillus sp. WLX2291 TaxID=3296934 RepID=UPI003983E426
MLSKLNHSTIAPQQIAQLLSICMWTDGDLSQLLRQSTAAYEQYRIQPERDLYGWLDEYRGAFTGVLGMTIQDRIAEKDEPICHVISHLAVLPELQAMGIGRRMIEDYIKQHPDVSLYAETDSDAVGFYQRCGFDIVALGEYYPGVLRFGCTR